MATRAYDFLQSFTTSTSPVPGTPSNDNDVVNKGYADDTYARRASFYDKSANNAAIKAIASADRSDGQITLNMASDSFYRFNSASTATDDADTVLAPDSGTGRWLKISGGTAPAADNITLQLDQHVSTFLAAEDLSARDVVCAELHPGPGSYKYHLFKADHDLSNRRSVTGICKTAVSTTPEVKTYTISAAYVSGNLVPITINGRSYSTSYASSSDATLQALATLIATDADVKSAVVTVVGGNQTGTDDRVIVITGSNGINGGTGAVSLDLTGTTVTGGVSQPTVTIGTTTAASRTAIDVVTFGAVDGFSSLTPGDLYYLSSTAGGITNTPGGSAIYVGRAASDTSLFVDLEGTTTQRWGGTGIFIKFGGSNNAGSPTSAQSDSEHFNLSTWSAGTSITAAKRTASYGETSHNSLVYALSGLDSTGAVTVSCYSYNKTSWSALTNITAERMSSAAGSIAGKILVGGGMDNGGTNQDDLFSWNGSSWTNEGNLTSGNKRFHCGFVVSGTFSRLGGWTTGVTSEHDLWNGSSFSAGTVFPTAAVTTCGGRSTGNKALTGGLQSNSTASYEWNGSTWSASITMAYDTNDDAGDNRLMGAGNGGFLANSQFTLVNGGTDSASAVMNQTQKYNGSTWSTSIASSNSRSVSMGGTI